MMATVEQAASLPVRLVSPGMLPEAKFPALAGKGLLGGRPTAYVCEQGRCEGPTSDPDTLRAQLREALAR